MMTWILIKWLVKSVHVIRHLFCLTRNFDNDRSLSNSNDRSLVQSSYNTSFYKTIKHNFVKSSYNTSFYKTIKHNFIKQIIHIICSGISKVTHTRYLQDSPNTLGYRLGRVRLFKRYLVWVILRKLQFIIIQFLYNLHYEKFSFYYENSDI